jgi:hypothetical protein
MIEIGDAHIKYPFTKVEIFVYISSNSAAFNFGGCWALTKTILVSGFSPLTWNILYCNPVDLLTPANTVDIKIASKV